MRPADGDQKSIPVEKTTFSLAWTQAAPVSARLDLPPSVAVGAEFKGTATIVNNSDFVNSANFTLLLPTNTTFVRGETPPEKIENGRVVWKLTDLAPRSSQTLGFYLVRETPEPLVAEGEIQLLPSNSGSNAAPTQGSGTAVPAPETLGTTPPVESPTPTPPAPAPLPADGTPPVESPTPDAASQQPALGAVFPASPVAPVAAGIAGAVVEIADASAPTLETVAFRFPSSERVEKTPRFREVSADLDEENAPDGVGADPDSPFVPATPEAGTPFEARFALTVPSRGDAAKAPTSEPEKEKVVVKLVARPGLALLLPDGTRRADVAYPAAPLAELADVVYKVRLVADAPGPKALAFYAFRENGDLLTTDVLPITVAQPSPTAATSETAQAVQSAQDAPSAPKPQSVQADQSAPSSRLSEESASVFPQNLPVAERRPDGSVGAATDRARVGVPFVYRAVVRNFEEFAIEPNELDVALVLPPELAFAPTNADSAKIEPNRRRAVFRLGKRLAPRSEFELNVDLAAAKPGVVELEFQLLDAATGALLADGRRPLEIVASNDGASNDAQEPR